MTIPRLPRPVPGRRLAMAALSAGLSCLGACVFGGGGTETDGLRPAGRAAYADGRPAAGARVRVRPAGFLAGTAPLPGTSADTVADRRGAFPLPPLADGDYVIEIRDSLNFVCALAYRPADTARPSGVLRPAAAVRGRLAGGVRGGQARVYGLDRAAMADTGGAFALPDMPGGDFRLRVDADSAAGGAPLRLEPGDDLDVGEVGLATAAGEDYAGWAHSQAFYLDTSATGVSGAVAGFPLLVRLGPGDAPLLAGGAGNDLRFTDGRGRHLPYQIEWWEPGAGAALWVRVDSLRAGADTAPALRLYWGRPGAPDRSSGPSVFGQDFAAAWHLAEEAPDTLIPGLYRDATGGGSDGDDRIASTGRDGADGPGRLFARRDYIQVPAPGPRLKPARNFTVTAWVRPAPWAGADTMGGEIATMADDWAIQVTPPGNVLLSAQTPASVDWSICQTQGVDVADGAWHHVAGVWGDTTLDIFVDGVPKAHGPLPGGRIEYRLSGAFRIGRHAWRTGWDFRGGLDEVEVAAVARDRDWLRWAWASQRPGSRLLRPGPAQ